jgi:transcriptional regulator with XRE-family HTH domain
MHILVRTRLEFMQKRRWHSLGQALRKLREERDLKQKEVGDRSGETIGERTLRSYESGVECPGRDRLLKLLIRSFDVKIAGDINRYLQMAGYAALVDREILEFNLETAVKKRSNGAIETSSDVYPRFAHGTSYQTPEAISTRLTGLVTHSPKKRKLYVAIGEGDFVKAWLSRLMQASTGLRIPAISGLVILGLSPEYAMLLEGQGRLKPGFARNMRNNIEAVVADTALPLEYRVWPRDPEFHGYLYGDVALYGTWAVDKQGRTHVLTPVFEVCRREDPARIQAMHRAFQTAPHGPTFAP